MPLSPRLPLFAASLTLLALILAAVSLNATFTPTAQAQTTTATDYDSNDDGLIEITTLAQLNAIRWDLNGDGVVDYTDNQAVYTAAFPNAAAGMGCPDGSDADTNPDPCIGYELKADLTFDSNGDGSVTAADSDGLYWNGGAGWIPLGNAVDDYHGEFQGRGQVISHLFINNSTRVYLGLFGSIGDGGRVSGLGLEQVSISSTATPSAGGLAGSNTGVITASYARGTISSNASASGNALTGGLVGYNGLAGTVQASFAAVAVSNRNSQPSAIAGGLVGQNAGSIQASYAAGAVSVHGTSQFTRAGGLVGSNGGGITASYARGRVTASGSGSVAGGLVGRQASNGRATNSYWDTTTSGLSSSAGGTGQSSSVLQTMTGYTGIYAHWNLNLDGTSGGDSPWYFGAANQYPVPVYGTARDYDADNDQLLEVDNLAQLNAIRWDLNGDGVVAATDAANYAAVFPWPAAGMGCADGATAAACIGYELQTDLDFDTNGSGSVTAADSGGLYWNDGWGWQPIGKDSYIRSPDGNSWIFNGGFEGTFQGNGKTIANLYINEHVSFNIIEAFGLFGYTSTTGVIDGVKLRDVNIRIQAVGWPVGALVGGNYGTIRDSSVTGSMNLNSAGSIWAGGLVGRNYGGGNITGSYAKVEIEGNAVRVGGLVGVNEGSIVGSYSTGAVSSTSNNNARLGGLVASNYGRISASYSQSPVKATGDRAEVGGLAGVNFRYPTGLGKTTGSGAIITSYAVGPVMVTGNGSSVGGLEGVNSGVATITASYSNSPVRATGNMTSVGGLVGLNIGTITASYSLSPVKATGNNAKVAGLAGHNRRLVGTQGRGTVTYPGTITASYAAGPVVVTGDNSSVGGLVGETGLLDGDGNVRANTLGTAVNSYWDIQVSGQSSSALGTGKTTAELTDPTGYSGIYANWNLNLDGQAGNDDPWDFRYYYPKLKYGGIDLRDQLHLMIDTDGGNYPVAGERMESSFNVSPRLTSSSTSSTTGGQAATPLLLGTGRIAWEVSDDGVTGWTAVTSQYPDSGSERLGRNGIWYLTPNASEANKRFRFGMNTQERGMIYSPPTPPVKASWTGATAALSFASGHNPPRVGQQITVSGGKAWFIRCNAAAGSGCVVMGNAAGITPNASDQGKYLYAYRYYTDSNGVLTKASTGFIGPIQAAASP